jgi:hypothetical protein
MKENIFYIVINDDFPTDVSHKHETFEGADIEAQRLAYKCLGQRFIVMQSLVGYHKNELVKSEFVEPYENDDDIPF